MAIDTSKRPGAEVTNRNGAYSLEPTLTVIGLTTQGRFFREKVAYSLEVDGYHYSSKHEVAEQASVLLEVEDSGTAGKHTKIRAKIISVKPSDDTPGMIHCIAQQEKSHAQTQSAPVSASRPTNRLAPSAPGKPSAPAPANNVTPFAPPAAAPEISVVPAPPLSVPEPQPVVLDSSVPTTPTVDVQAAHDAVASAIGFEVEEVSPVRGKSEPELLAAAKKSVDAAAEAYTDQFVRQQLAARLESQAEEVIRKCLDSYTDTLIREQLTARLESLAQDAASKSMEQFTEQSREVREKFEQDLAKDVEAAQANARVAATDLEQLRAQATRHFQSQKADLQDWADTLQKSFAHSPAVEEALNSIRARMEAEVASRLADAQRELEAHLEQSKEQAGGLLKQLEEFRATSATSSAEVSQALTQMNLLRQNLKAELSAADGRIAKLLQDASTRLGDEAELRILESLRSADADLQVRLTAFQQTLALQLDTARKQSAGIEQSVEACGARARQSLDTVETARGSLEQLRDAWRAEQKSEEAKLQDISRRTLLLASAETTRMLNKAVAGLEEKFRERMAELQKSFDSTLAQAAQQVENATARLDKTKAAAASVLGDVDSSLARSTQTMDALNALQASLASSFRSELAAEIEKLNDESKRQLEQQSQRIVTLQVAALEKQAGMLQQAAEEALQRLAAEQKSAEAASRGHRESLQVEALKRLEEFRFNVAQATERMKSEVESATRTAHETLEKELSLKLKYLADHMVNISRKLFTPSCE